MLEQIDPRNDEIRTGGETMTRRGRERKLLRERSL
jgi:hypothetical protein